ncbi:hypothetical protein CEY11_10745 [Candidimonas nitroreducens]|uniref:Uncharacterized protein n=1 Tax=Candidimonas nitroreducens TaxID=683354 RepID=A0A225MFW4_9BURK|nr:hypothetical protein CEY11_10745 [Candidimonas nitroreducens]
MHAARAANGGDPLPTVAPCRRVADKSGAPTGYAGGSG